MVLLLIAVLASAPSVFLVKNAYLSYVCAYARHSDSTDML